MVVDTHHHLWDTTALHYPLFDSMPALQGEFTVEKYERAARSAGITTSIAVEAASAGTDPRKETAWITTESRRSSLVKGLVVWAPVDRPELLSYLDWLDSLGDSRIVGIRRSFEFDPPDVLRHNNVIEGVRLVGARGFSFDLVLFQPSLPAAAKLVRACPEVQFILDHLGKPRLREGIDSTWHVAIRDLAALPNVVCKISGLVTEADHAHWTTEQIQPYIYEVITWFGWDRVMFGSDWPICNLAGGLTRWLEAVQWCVADASPDEVDLFWRQNARRIYRIPMDLPGPAVE